MSDKKRDVILIIDDDSRNTFALNLTLKTKGYKSLAFNSAEEGLEILKNRENIALVLMDMMMPEMDGYQAIKEIQSFELNNEVPVIAVTAQAMSGDREKCIEAGAADYIAKPIDVDILLEVLKKWM
ncbi:response regulator [Moheibacter sediminis]|uniref:Response regulator receiver domain-containing protein n=1 Tax=Moheibacter sediminis TaxID=1434700 RepID=A0A1W2B150_9FLAO|nr:response regulator [Moheibacter sediminis]SMC66128.1 Response regulator receiver domain-containing protein [Moheibacter sediminis]